MRMIEHECGAIHLIEDSLEGIGIVPRRAQESLGDDLGLELLVAAVPKERCVDTEGNTKFRQLIFPGFRCRKTCCDRNRGLNKKLARQLRCCVSCYDVSHFMSEDCREFIFIRSDLNQS